MEKLTVTENREKYIGGSDIPIIMGLSPFKTRWELLQEKAGIRENDFKGNIYTQYGDDLEPVIRDYVSEYFDRDYKADVFYPADDVRINVDGIDDESVLEIKTTSATYGSLMEYKYYLVQLLYYIKWTNRHNGVLAVYDRPDDFSLELDPFRLQIFDFSVDTPQMALLLEEIDKAVESFKIDLEKLKENPSLTEQDLMPTEIQILTDEVALLEKSVTEYKKIETDYKALKSKLYEEMMKCGIKKYESNSGAKITCVLPTEDRQETVFDAVRAVEEQPELFDMYNTIKTVKGKAGYVKITLPKM